jgi:pimeloyl-ACP methyl ester carboxylesterase
MSFVLKKWIAITLPIVLFSSLMFLVDGCMQFRMSKSEVDAYFATKERKGVLHHYPAGKRTMSYLEVGDSALPLVVFVHGSPGSLSAFIDFMADTALLAHAMLITVDRPGFGASNFGYAEPSLEKQAALLKPILENHKSQRPIILVGHSLGGPLIARMAMDYPHLIDGLVMVAPSIDPELEPNEWFRGPLATPFLKWMLPRSIRASNDEIYHLKPELEEMMPMWGKIKARTIVIQGKKDSLVPPGNADFARKMMTGADVKVVMVDGMDHFVPWNHPYLIRDAVLELLSKSKHME